MCHDVVLTTCTGEQVRELAGQEDLARLTKISSLAVSHDGQQLASFSSDGAVRVWRVSDGALVQEFGGLDVHDIAFTPDGQQIVALPTTTRRPTSVLDVSTGSTVRTLDQSFGWNGTGALSPDGRYVAAPNGYRVRIWDVTTGDTVATLSPDGALSTSAVAFSPNGGYMVTSYSTGTGIPGAHGTLHVWQVGTWDSVATMVVAPDSPSSHEPESVAFSPTGDSVISVSIEPSGPEGEDGAFVRIWNTLTGDSLGIVGPGAVSVHPDVRLRPAPPISPDGRYIAFSSPSEWGAREIGLWRLDTGELERTLTTHTFPSGYKWQTRITPDGANILRYIGDGVAVHDLASGKVGWVIDGADFSGFAVGADGQYVAGVRSFRLEGDDPTHPGSARANVYIASIATGDSVRTLDVGYESEINRVAFTPDGRHVVGVGSWHEWVSDPPGYRPEREASFVWDFDSGELLRRIDWAMAIHGVMAMTPDSRYLAGLGGYPEGLMLWDLNTGDSPGKIELPESSAPRSIALTPDGIHVVVAYHDRAVMYEMATGDSVREFTSDQAGLFVTAAISPDGKLLLLGQWDGRDVEMFDLATGTRVGRIAAVPPSPARDFVVSSISVTPDGRHAVVATGQELQLWRLEETTGIGSPAIDANGRANWAALSQNTPNPFNPSTTVRFVVPESGLAHLAIYDLNGRLVRTLVDGTVYTGPHTAVWDGRDALGHEVASGVYLCRLATAANAEHSPASAKRTTLVRRMLLVR